MKILKPLSMQSPICRLPSQRSPVHVSALCMLWVLSTACLLETAAPAWLIAILASASACYLWLSIKAILKSEPLFLLLHADGRLELESSISLEAIIASNWQDFGYLKILDHEIDGKKVSFYWWRCGMSLDQRRSLWRIMNAWVKVMPKQPPSLTINPLL